MITPEPSDADFFSCPETVQNYLRELEIRYAMLLKQPTWKEINTAPRDGSFITGIWWSGNITHGFPFVCQWINGRWLTPDSKDNVTVREPSHWLPLNLPKVKS